MLYTNLKHLENSDEYARAIHENQRVVIICGRMEYGCISLFRIAEELEKAYPQVQFYDMEFDNPESMVIRSLPEINSSTAIPLVICYENGVVTTTTCGPLTRREIISLLNEHFTNPIHV